MLTLKQRKELKQLKLPLVDEALKEITTLEERLLRMEYDIDLPSLFDEIKQLKSQIKTQQDALNAVTPIIDNLREENDTLKKNLYTQQLTNEIGKYKQLYNKTSDDYTQLYTRYELLLSKYIRQ